jgi:hypothetical protein
MTDGQASTICRWDFLHVVIRDGREVELFSGKTHDEMFGRCSVEWHHIKEEAR